MSTRREKAEGEEAGARQLKRRPVNARQSNVYKEGIEKGFLSGGDCLVAVIADSQSSTVVSRVESKLVAAWQCVEALGRGQCSRDDEEEK